MVELGLKQLLIDAGVSFGVAAAQALARGEIDGFWANAMGAEIALRHGTARATISRPFNSGSNQGHASHATTAGNFRH
jgi:hypothetical protein